MPVHEEVRNGRVVGYRWGRTGKLYRTRAKAEAQARAIYARGYRDSVTAAGGPSQRRQVHVALTPPRHAEQGYKAALRAILRGVHRGVQEMVEREILAPTVRRDETHTGATSLRTANLTVDERDSVNHRDLKPENGLVTAGPDGYQGEINVNDSTRGAVVMGHFGNKSPEDRSDAPGRPADRARRVLTTRLKEKVARHIHRQVGPYFDTMARSVDARSRTALGLIGIPISEATHNVSHKIAKARSENIALMERAGRRYVDDVLDVFTDPDAESLRVEELADRIHARAGVSESHAELIAVDQTLKLSAAINEARQVDAGVAIYRWSTSLDERVRPMHQDLEGQEFDWSDPPVTNDDGETNHPGEDYRCRCIAIPVIPELEEGQEDEAAE